MTFTLISRNTGNISRAEYCGIFVVGYYYIILTLSIITVYIRNSPYYCRCADREPGAG